MNKKNILKELKDEFFLAYYKKGNFKNYAFTKEEFEFILSELKKMSLDKSYEQCEKIYAQNILIMIKDIEKILKNFKIDIKKLKKNDILYTYKNNKYGTIQKWKIIKILKYNNYSFGSKYLFELLELNFKNRELEKENKYIMDNDELFKYASQNYEYFGKQELKKNKKYFSHITKLFENKDII